MGIPFTMGMGFLFTATMGKLFTMTLGIQLTISTKLRLLDVVARGAIGDCCRLWAGNSRVAVAAGPR